MKVTPMMKQFLEAKSDHPDCIVFFRMGDFYETFLDDAELVSRELDLLLTSRDKGEEGGVPMAGVPHRSADGYIRRLIGKGYRVAICEQLEDPAVARGIVRRGVVRVITPGSLLDDDAIDAKANHHMVALARGPHADGDVWALAAVDLSTGELRVTELLGSDALGTELRRLSPAEVVVAESQAGEFASFTTAQGAPTTRRPDASLDLRRVVARAESSPLAVDERTGRRASHSTSDLLAMLSPLDATSFRDRAAVDASLALLLDALIGTMGGVPSHVSAPFVYRADTFLTLDPATTANLEIFETLMGGRKKGSLFSAIDMTLTGAGGRRLRTWLSYPLTDPARIADRQDAIAHLVDSMLVRERTREVLKATHDIQRLVGRLSTASGTPRDLVALRRTLERIPEVHAALGGATVPAIEALRARLDPCEDVATLVARAIEDDPPPSLSDGGVIREGYHAELDEWIGLSRDGKQWIARYEQSERQRTGIPSLKVRHNNVFGWSIEVTRANQELVPPDYIRKQTLANAERYYTPELKEYEEKLVQADDRRRSLEFRLFEEVRRDVLTGIDRLRETASMLAELDALAALAELAHRRQWVRPTVDGERRIDIEEGRHPVVELTLDGGRFVPNDTLLHEEQRLLLVTGPNMAGKSTVIRQVALIVLLAQIGSFVPARRASIGVVDQLFSRVGASDNLARGQSTFMVEMSETAHILRNASPRSLVILDEIGRGTSTWDGLSIAWAVAEYLHDHIGALTLFATHYHELTELVRTRSAVRNCNIAVREWNEEIIFLHKLVEGPANRSYGIQVARLAGVPQPVIERAREVLSNLEATELSTGERPPPLARERRPRRASERDSGQLALFGGGPEVREVDRLREEIDRLALDHMSPIEALTWLHAVRGRPKPS